MQFLLLALAWKIWPLLNWGLVKRAFPSNQRRQDHCHTWRAHFKGPLCFKDMVVIGRCCILFDKEARGDLVFNWNEGIRVKCSGTSLHDMICVIGVMQSTLSTSGIATIRSAKFRSVESPPEIKSFSHPNAWISHEHFRPLRRNYQPTLIPRSPSYSHSGTRVFEDQS